MFKLEWTNEAKETYQRLKDDKSLSKRHKAVRKTIQFLAANPRHNSLKSHEYKSLKGPKGEKVYTVYAEQNTPAAYRVFWYYGPSKGVITVFAITSHP